MLDHARRAVGTALRGPLPRRYAMLRLELRPLRSAMHPDHGAVLSCSGDGWWRNQKTGYDRCLVKAVCRIIET